MKKITKIITFYDDGSFTESYPSQNNPYQPINPPYRIPTTDYIPSTCSKCGMKLEGAIGYACINHPCPSGLGGSYSIVSDCV